MIIVGNTLISEDIRDRCFACDLEQCKGGCCVEGDAGAPLEEEEVSNLEDFLEDIIPFMAEAGAATVKKWGVFDYDIHVHLVTPLVNDKECAFAWFEDGIARCAIEAAYDVKKIPFAKPLSCHLYPIRIIKTRSTEGLNYHRWHICEAARTRGKKEKIKLFMFLKDPLIRKFGNDWYNELLAAF